MRSVGCCSVQPRPLAPRCNFPLSLPASLSSPSPPLVWSGLVWSLLLLSPPRLFSLSPYPLARWLFLLALSPLVIPCLFSFLPWIFATTSQSFLFYVAITKPIVVFLYCLQFSCSSAIPLIYSTFYAHSKTTNIRLDLTVYIQPFIHSRNWTSPRTFQTNPQNILVSISQTIADFLIYCRNISTASSPSSI